VVAVCLVGLAVVSASLFVAGARKNAQITSLRTHGVPVTATVTACIGLMGGSGSNLAGYSCRGRFTLHGHSYTDDIPGNALYPPGARIRAVTVPSDPALLTTARMLAGERASASVFAVPAVLAAVLFLVGTWIARSKRRVRRAESPALAVATA